MLAVEERNRFKSLGILPIMGKNNVKMMGVAAVVIIVCLLVSWAYM